MNGHIYIVYSVRERKSERKRGEENETEYARAGEKACK